MKVLLIGSGGREHSLALKLADSPKLTQLFIAPGNPGTAQVGENIPIKVSEIDKLVTFAKKEKVDLTFVGPEQPLVDGIVDEFEKQGLVIIGPSKKGAQLEGSKKWAKDFYKKYEIPTASYEVLSDYPSAINYLEEKNTYPIVIKADGLAAGKGVTIDSSFAQASASLTACFIDEVFAEAGKTVVIEEFLQGEEASILAFTDGETVLPMVAAQDHKAIYDGDKGPNTGGMGAYSPAPVVTKEVEKKVYEKIFLPMLEGFKKEGIVYKGILYAGLMIKDGEPSVVEFNVRFGDPETQVVLPRMKNDLLDILVAIKENDLKRIVLEWKEETAVCVVLASGGYPGKYEKGKSITGLSFFENEADIQVIQAGTREDEQGNILTNGGRVLGAVGLDQDLRKAIDKAYVGVDKIEFEGKYCRKDIGFKAL
ncbi:phosphoribosylamine--glycine ligase [bacterium]|nr:phosphoribosylamine--glycine ligase [bacterium]MBT4552774.1 phosphoribosylamine--glycine ligase [bacterium]MBT5988862.1 phosphoribosylamine--glycine ligase [bacterium]